MCCCTALCVSSPCLNVTVPSSASRVHSEGTPSRDFQAQARKGRELLPCSPEAPSRHPTPCCEGAQETEKPHVGVLVTRPREPRPAEQKQAVPLVLPKVPTRSPSQKQNSCCGSYSTRLGMVCYHRSHQHARHSKAFELHSKSL